MIENAGITSTSTQLLINAINPIFSMMGAIYGATLLDKLGRRKMLLGGLAGGLIAYCFLTAFTASSESNPRLAYGTIVSIFVFGVFFGEYREAERLRHGLGFLSSRAMAKLRFDTIMICALANFTASFSLGLDSSSDPLRRRMSREPHTCEGQRSQLPVPQRRHGCEHVWHLSRDRKDWLETIPCVHRLDRD
jgi:MFS family permease